MKRHQTINVVNQGDRGDCAIWVFSNAFMREIVLLLGWESVEPLVDWELLNPDNCSKYDVDQQEADEDKYKYCVLYTFIQIFLRKNFGSCGVDASEALTAFCDKFNELMTLFIDLSRLTSANIIDVQVDTEQQRWFIPQLTVKIQELLNLPDDTFTEDITPDQIKRCKSELDETKIRLRELTTTPQYIPDLLNILNEIKTALADQKFVIKSYILNDFYQKDSGLVDVTRHLETPDDPLFANLQRHFNNGNGSYAICAFECSKSELNKIGKLHASNNERIDPTITLNNIISLLNPTSSDIRDPSYPHANYETELDKMVSDYLSLKSGLKYTDHDSAGQEAILFDAFISMMSNVTNDTFNSINLGHAVIVKNIFKYGMDPELGNYYYIMKNSWASQWLINGGGVLPVNIHPYIAFLFFERINSAAAAPLQATIFRKTVVCLPDESDNTVEISIPIATRRERIRLSGGKRCNRSKKRRRKITHKNKNNKNYKNNKSNRIKKQKKIQRKSKAIKRRRRRRTRNNF